MTQVEKNMAVSALAQLLDQQPTAYAEVLAACRAMGWTASPTAQPADIIDELPSNVLPFIRRMLALLIYGDGSADSPAVVPVTDRCYAQLVPRVTSPNYPAAGFPSDHPFLPQVPSIRDFAHLPQALSALSPRKITNGAATNDGIADGVSLAQLVCGTTAAAAVLKIKDDSKGWTLVRSLPPFTNATEIELGCSLINYPFNTYADNRTNQGVIVGYNSLTKLKVYELKEIKSNQSWSQGCIVKNCPELTELDMSGLEYIRVSYLVYNCPKLARVRFGTLKTTFVNAYNSNPTETFSGSNSKLIDLEFGAGTAVNLWLGWWSPDETVLSGDNLDQFLQNFRSHIALRLTDNGSGLTLTLSQAVRNAIHAAESTYGIEDIIVNQKHWTLSPAPSA